MLLPSKDRGEELDVLVPEALVPVAVPVPVDDAPVPDGEVAVAAGPVATEAGGAVANISVYLGIKGDKGDVLPGSRTSNGCEDAKTVS